MKEILEVEISVFALMVKNSISICTLKLDLVEIIFPKNDVKGPCSILTLSPALKM